MDSLILKPYIDKETKNNYYQIIYNGKNKILEKINQNLIKVKKNFINYDFDNLVLKFDFFGKNQIVSQCYKFHKFYLEIL